MKRRVVVWLSSACISALTVLNAEAASKKYTIDQNHANITWHANHMGFSNPSGKFAKSEGIIIFDEDRPQASTVNVTIDATSIVTGIPAFDEHLASADFFNIEKHKTITFKSSKIVILEGKTADVHGNLTILGVTKPVVINAVLNKSGENPFTKKQTVGFSGTTTIKRSDFGMKTAIGPVSDEVKIDLEIEAFIE